MVGLDQLGPGRHGPGRLRRSPGQESGVWTLEHARARGHVFGHLQLTRAPSVRAPGVRGPDLVRVSWSGIAFCIDSTEVTNAQYQEFLAAPPPTPVPRCGWNTSLQPATTGGAGCGALDPVGHASLPVTCVDWCDAEA